MNAFRKSFVYIAIGLIIFGLIAIIVGAAFGGLKNNFVFQDKDNKTYTYESEEITSINIDMDAGNLEIKTGSEFKIIADNIVSSNLTSTVSDGVWDIEYTLRKSHIFGNITFNLGNWSSVSSKITVIIPTDTKLDNLDLEFGAGNFELTDLNVEDLSLAVGAGNVEISNLVADNVVLDVGVGNLVVSGKILNDSTINCGVGQVELNLEGNYEDYDYEIEVGLGSTKINDQSYSGVSDKSISHSDSIGTFEIDCGVGEVVLKIS